MDPKDTSVLRPGILVGLKTRLTGGIAYDRKDLPTDGTTGKARWETERTIDDPEEYDKATKARSAARSMVTKECCSTSFGLLCPQGNEAALDIAVAKARELVRVFNASSKNTTISVRILKGRIAGSDKEAAEAVAVDVGEMIAEMQAGLDALDINAVRKAADAASAMADVLIDDKAEVLKAAVAQARAGAKLITKEVKVVAESQGQKKLDVESLKADLPRSKLIAAAKVFAAAVDISDGPGVTEVPVARSGPAIDLGDDGPAQSAEA
jgi:hypothetical protein